LLDAAVRAVAVADIGRVLHHRERREDLSHAPERAVARGVVDEDDALGRKALGGQRAQAVEVALAAVPVDDDGPGPARAHAPPSGSTASTRERKEPRASRVSSASPGASVAAST